MDCIFCKIVAGEIPSYKVYEDVKYLAFLDISQITDGHTLVIPKKHVRWVWDVEDVGGYFGAVRKVANRLQEVSGEEMVMGAVWGEMVPHAHVHLVPRTEGSLEGIEKAWNEALGKRKVESDRMEEIRGKFEVKGDKAAREELL